MTLTNLYIHVYIRRPSFCAKKERKMRPFHTSSCCDVASKSQDSAQKLQGRSDLSAGQDIRCSRPL